MDITTRLKHVVQRVRDSEKRFGRNPGSVQILPVSKTRPIENILEVAQQGFKHFGENYLQEAQDKISALASEGLIWHYIGPLQSNKTQQISELFQWVHSVDRQKIAKRLNDQRPENFPPLNICLQVNISGETSKSGISPAQITELALSCIEFPRLRLRGLMAIPAPETDFDQQRQTFNEVRLLFDQLKSQLSNTDVDLDTLSMGMSNDLEAAIAEGSTLVRIGTDIFGPRN